MYEAPVGGSLGMTSVTFIRPSVSVPVLSIATTWTVSIERLRTELVRMQDREIVLKKSLGILSETPGSGMPKSKP